MSDPVTANDTSKSAQSGDKGAAPKPASSAPPADPKTKDFVLFNEKIELHFNQPLPQFNVDRNMAYRAYAKDRGRTPLLVLVCERHLTPRLSAAPVYSVLINPNMAQLIDHGKVFWPPAGQERYVFVYLDNLGVPVLKDSARAALGWRQEDVLQWVVKPMMSILQDFRDKDFVHGAIRPSNMFDSGANEKSRKIILGDCLSTPSSYTQPVLYEPIERAMTMPIARGHGTQADDLYSFGVSLAVFMRFHDPLYEMSPLDVIKQKINNGSYAAITGKDRFKGEILELLRGLLHDDPTQRWKLDEVMVWLDGRRLSPKQAVMLKKATRPMPFANDKFFIMPLLALALDSSTAELKKVVEDNSLQQWLERSLENDEAVQRYEKSLQHGRAQGTGPGYEERLAANMSIALDPSAPIRYKNRSYLGDGLGTAMAETMALKQNPAVYAEMISNSLVLNWLAVQQMGAVDVVGLHNKFDLCRRYLNGKRIGEGLERCLYLLCPEAACMSENLRQYYCTTPEELLYAFEDMCEKKTAPQNFLDRHVVAFLQQKESKLIDTYMFDLNSGLRHKIILANLKCMAGIQRRFDAPDMPGLTQYFQPLLKSVVSRYHDNLVREKLNKSIEEYALSGNLQKMAALLDNQDVIKKDYVSFMRAMAEYRNLDEEKTELVLNMAEKDDFGLESGREWSAIVASVLSGLIILLTVVMYLGKKSLF